MKDLIVSKRTLYFWLALVGLILLMRLGMASLIPNPYIFIDELVYSKMARGLASGSLSEWAPYIYNPTILYPLLNVPAELLSNPYATFKLTQITNILLFSSGAIPLFLLARLLVSPGMAAGITLFSLLAPYNLYANVVMTENLFYPLVMWAAYLTVRVSLDARPVFAIWLSIICGLAFFTKPHGMFLPIVILPTLLLCLFLGRRDLKHVSRTLLSFWPAALVYAGFLVAHVIKTNLFHNSHLLDLTKLLGFYGSSITGRPLELSAFLNSFGGNLGAVAIAIGFLPLALFLPFSMRAIAKGDAPQRALAVFTLLLGLFLLGITARHTVILDNPIRIHERYCFYLEPLILLGALSYVQKHRMALLGMLGLSLVLLIGSTHYIPQVIPTPLTSDTPVYAAMYPLQAVLGLPAAMWVVRGLGVLFIGILAWLLMRQRWTFALALLAVYSAGLSSLSFAYQQKVSQGNGYARHFAGWVAAHSDPTEPMVYLVDGINPVNVWISEFFNEMPTKKYFLAQGLDGWNDVRLQTQGDGKLPELSQLPDGARIVASRNVVLDQPVLSRLEGEVIYEKRGEVTIKHHVTGRHQDDWTDGNLRLEFYVQDASKREAEIRATLAPEGMPRDLFPMSVTLEDGMGNKQMLQLAESQSAEIRFKAQRLEGVPFTISIQSPTWSPSQVSGSPDTRNLGLRIADIEIKDLQGPINTLQGK